MASYLDSGRSCLSKRGATSTEAEGPLCGGTSLGKLGAASPEGEGGALCGGATSDDFAELERKAWPPLRGRILPSISGTR